MQRCRDGCVPGGRVEPLPEADAVACRRLNPNILSRRNFGQNQPSVVVMEVDNSLDLEFVINQAKVAADRYIAVVAWRRRQAAHQIG